MKEYVAREAAPVEPRLCSLVAAAEALGVSRRTVGRMVADGRLRSIHVGGRHLIPTSALDEFVARELEEGAA